MTVPSPAGMPAWEWLLGLVIIGAVTLVITWLQNRPVRREVRAVGADARSAADDAAAAAITAKTAADDVADVRHEVHPNSGKSMRDKVDKLVDLVEELRGELAQHGQRLAEQSERLVEQSKDIGGLRSELRQERSERADLAGRVTHIEQQH